MMQENSSSNFYGFLLKIPTNQQEEMKDQEFLLTIFFEMENNLNHPKPFLNSFMNALQPFIINFLKFEQRPIWVIKIFYFDH